MPAKVRVQEMKRSCYSNQFKCECTGQAVSGLTRVSCRNRQHLSWILRLREKSPFGETYREILEIDCVSDSAAPPKSKTMPEMKYLDTKAFQEFFDFFTKKYFFAIFSQIFDTAKSKISRSDRSGDVTDPGRSCLKRARQNYSYFQTQNHDFFR